jgi:Tfp pilus assembly protein PilE
LATVVLIVGILAVIGIVTYRRYVKKAHLAEATSLTAGIRSAQVGYKAEHGVYANVSNDTTSYYPATNPGSFATMWGGPCGNCANGMTWDTIPVKPNAPVFYGYATVAGVGFAAFNAANSTPQPAAGAAPPPSPGLGPMAIGGPQAIKPDDPYYISVAWGDPNGDGEPTIVYGYSMTNNVIIQGEGN